MILKLTQLHPMANDQHGELYIVVEKVTAILEMPGGCAIHSGEEFVQAKESAEQVAQWIVNADDQWPRPRSHFVMRAP